MTAICALVEHLDGGDKVWVGGDSAGVSGWSLTPRADPKVFVTGPFVMGFSGSFRLGDLLRWTLEPPFQPEGVSDERFMATTFVEAVRKCAREGGLSKKENEVETLPPGGFLVGYHGRIWSVDWDFQVGRPIADFDAVGSGHELCVGSLDATQEDPGREPLPPSGRILSALATAEKFNAGVRGPFVVLREP